MTNSEETAELRVEHQARIEQVRPRRMNWWLPLLAIALAAYLGAETWFKRGPLLTIHTDQGYSVGIGDPLKYRGVVLGEVESAELAPGLDSVTLRIRLLPEAEALCRVGSRFWIVHPEVGLDRVQGLETIVGARYIRVDPGDMAGPALYEFSALADSPAREWIEPGGLSIRLLAMSRAGLARGAHVTYRGVQVGTVLETRLTSDATGVEIDAYIRAPYVELVRENSRFWRTGGFEVNLALLRGLSVELDSLRGLMVGGIAFATPDDPDGVASSATAFELHDEAQRGWEEWRPSLSLGTGSVEPAHDDSPVVRAKLTYEAGWWSRDKQLSGWVIVLPGAVLGPRELLEIPEGAKENSARLTVDGMPVSLVDEPLWQGLGLVKRKLELDSVRPLFAASVAFGPLLQDCLIGNAPAGERLSVSRARLVADESGWHLDDEIDLQAVETGAPVFGQADGRTIGILVKNGDGARIVPFLAEQW